MKKLLSILTLSLISFGAVASEESLVQDILHCGNGNDNIKVSRDLSLETLLLDLGGVVYHVPESEVVPLGITEITFPFDKGEVAIKLGETPSLILDAEEGIAFYQCL